MRLSSPAQELGAGSTRDGVHRNLTPENPAPDPPCPPPNRITTADAHGDYDSKLSEILAMPKMTGAAVAVAFGNYLECIRSIGESAPPIGSRCCAGVGLTGACFATGKVQLCNDTENDSRADRQACGNLGVRSVLVVSFKRGSTVTGILEVLSSKPNAFNWRAIRHIKRIARGLGAVPLESCVNSPGPNEAVEQTPTRAVRAPASELDLQKVLYCVWSIQQHGAASAIASTVKDAKKLLEAQADCEQGQGSKWAELPIQELPVKELSAQRGNDPATIGTREDAVPSFGTVEEWFADGDRRPSFVALAIAFAILLACFFVFRTHPASLSALLDFASQIPKSSSRSSPAALHQYPHTAEEAKTQPESPSRNDLHVEESAPSQQRTKKAIPRPSTDALAKSDEAAQNGDADASWNVGMSYLKGVGVPKDKGRAARWLKKAANLGDPRAQVTLSDLYLRGIGVRRDYVRAYTWATIAAGQLGGEDERLAALRQRMTRAELEDANRRVETWFAQKDR